MENFIFCAMEVLKVLADIFELSQKTNTRLMDPPTLVAKNTCAAVKMKVLRSKWSTIFLTSTKLK